MSSRDSLHDHGTSEAEECVSPEDVRGRVISSHLAVPSDAIFTSGQARRGAGFEHIDLMLRGFDVIRAGKVAEIRKRVAYGGHFPVQNANDPRLGLVEDHVVDFVVAMYQGAPVARLGWLVREEAHHIFKVRELAYRLPGISVLSLRLRLGDRAESGNLSVVEPTGFPELLQPNVLGDDGVEFGQCTHSILPSTLLSDITQQEQQDIQCISLLRAHLGHGGVCKYPPIQEFHDVEWGSNNVAVFA